MSKTARSISELLPSLARPVWVRRIKTSTGSVRDTVRAYPHCLQLRRDYPNSRARSLRVHPKGRRLFGLAYLFATATILTSSSCTTYSSSSKQVWRGSSFLVFRCRKIGRLLCKIQH